MDDITKEIQSILESEGKHNRAADKDSGDKNADKLDAKDVDSKEDKTNDVIDDADKVAKGPKKRGKDKTTTDDPKDAPTAVKPDKNTKNSLPAETIGEAKDEDEDEDTDTEDQEDGDDYDGDMDESKDKKSKALKKEAFTYEINVDLDEDLKGLTNNKDLSEDFKAQVKTVFEAAVTSKSKAIVEQIIGKLDEQFEERVELEVAGVYNHMVEHTNNYLTYVVEDWKEDNRLAVETGLRTQLTDNIVKDIKAVFENHNVDLPDDKVDIVETLQDENDLLKEELSKAIKAINGLNESATEDQRAAIVSEAVSDLAETEKDKLTELAEGLVYEDADTFKNKMTHLVNTYIDRQQDNTQDFTEQFSDSDSEIIVEEETVKTPSKMDIYTKTATNLDWTKKWETKQ